MHFLFNSTVFELGDPTERASRANFPFAIGALRSGRVVSLVRHAVLETPRLELDKPNKAMDLAALVVMHVQANALIAVPAAPAKTPLDVAVRFADVGLTTLANLYNRQQSLGALAPGDVNAAVWLAA